MVACSADLLMQLTYACQLLGIAAMTAAKTSVAMLFKRIPQSAHFSYYLILCLIAAWAIFSFFASALQCSSPEPWTYVPTQCSIHVYLQYPVIIFNMLTDAMLAIGILPTIWKLQMQKSTRIYLVCLFGSRIM